MHQTVLNALKMGNKVLLVDFRQPPHMLLEELRNHGIDYSPYIENGSLLILDGYSNLYGQSRLHGKERPSKPPRPRHNDRSNTRDNKQKRI